jgi:anti-sigma B factor antagonist
MNQPFHAEIRQVNDQVIIDLQGEINALANQELFVVYEQAENSTTGTILLNFENVSYINSTGIAIIVGLLTKARQSQHKIAACGLSDHYMEIFDITRLSDYIKVYLDETSALLELRAQIKE